MVSTKTITLHHFFQLKNHPVDDMKEDDDAGLVVVLETTTPVRWPCLMIQKTMTMICFFLLLNQCIVIVVVVVRAIRAVAVAVSVAPHLPTTVVVVVVVVVEVVIEVVVNVNNNVAIILCAALHRLLPRQQPMNDDVGPVLLLWLEVKLPFEPWAEEEVEMEEEVVVALLE